MAKIIHLEIIIKMVISKIEIDLIMIEIKTMEIVILIEILQINGNRPRFDKNRPNNNSGFDNRNRQGGNPRFGGNQRFGGNRPLDEKGIERNIKDIMGAENVEKETTREYNKSIDKQKQNSRFDDNKNKKSSKSRRNNQNGDINEHKLKGSKENR